MSVLYAAERGEPWAPPPGACFYCSCPIDPEQPAVYWMGGTDTGLELHPDCAAELGVHLIGDSREARLAGGEPAWTRRAARALREGLLNAEARS